MKTYQIIVTEPGKGKAVNPYMRPDKYVESGIGYIDENNLKSFNENMDEYQKLVSEFEANNPIRDCIDIKGNALQVRSDPYLCKEVWQFKFMDLDWKNCYGLYSKESCEFDGIPLRCIYQLIDDAVKGEKWQIQHTKGWSDITEEEYQTYKDSNAVLRLKPEISTPVNEAKEVDELKQENGMLKLHLEHTKRLLSACETALEERDKSLTVTHHIENKEGVKSDKYPHLTRLSDDYQQTHKLQEEVTKFLSIEDGWYESIDQAFRCGANFGLHHFIKNYAAQFTPIEHGKRMVDEWISVEDALPETAMQIISGRWYNTEFLQDIVFYDGITKPAFTHWQPLLPEPPLTQPNQKSK